MAQDRNDHTSPLRVVGHSVTRVDARAKITGTAEFSADRFAAKNLLHGKTLRSPYAHAEILSIDTTEAESLPGVRAVVTYRDAPPIPFEAGGDGAAPVYLLNKILRHAGDEVAAVAAETEAIAEQALRAIQIEYRVLPFVLNEERALEATAPSVRGGTNLAGDEPIEFSRGDVEAGPKEADLVVEQTYRTQSTSPLALEPRYAVATWQGDRLTVWKASRNVYGDREKLARIFQLPHERVRVIAAYLGGGFGSKDETRLGLITALLAKKAGRPGRMGYTREEELGYGKWRHATTTKIKLALKRDGTITAIDAESALNTGPYAPGYGVASRLGHGLTYLYRCANARFVGRVAFTHAPVAVTDAPEVRIPVSHVIRRQSEQAITGEAKLRAGSKTHIINSFAAHFAEVEVDPDSGAVRVLRYVAVHDSGRIIHPEAARGQIIGGVVQGIGYALMEEIAMDPDTGAPLTLNLDSFKIPNLIDIPPIEAVLLEQPDPIGPYGAKALGEPPLVPVAAALANAVNDATGAPLRELPITAEKVLRSLRGQVR